ncbi:MAG: acyl-CoA thioesterase [Bacteroidales bacterium]|jgi:acyl-CoA thioester hydrolase|nr:acyl-CoA thioesterase [Bacteroidales bacterium]
MKIIVEEKTALTAHAEFRVRFSEVDAMDIVWHGNYARYFEDAREAFGEKYKIGFHDILQAGYTTPLVELSFNYKRPLLYGQKAKVEVFYKKTDAAKVILEYEIRDYESSMLLATGRTVQVFLDRQNQLVLSNPDFYLEWKRRNGL